jgi:hypothetical protein
VARRASAVDSLALLAKRPAPADAAAVVLRHASPSESRIPVPPSMLPNPDGIAATMLSFCEVSKLDKPLASRPDWRCCCATVPSTRGASIPSMDLLVPSPMPAYLPTAPATELKMFPPNSVESKPAPFSATARCSVPVVRLRRLSSVPDGCCDRTLDNCFAPSGFEARPTRPASIAGTEAPMAFCVL